MIYSEPGRQVVVEAGDHRFNRGGFRMQSGNQRPVSFSWVVVPAASITVTDNITEDYAGRAASSLSRGDEWNDISLPGGDFITRLITLNSEYAFNSTLYWVTLVQYDNVSEIIGVNTRLQWIPKAGQEGFIVLNYNMEDRDKDNDFSSLSRDLSLKFTYTFRF